MGGKGSGGRRRGAGRKPLSSEEKRVPITVWVLPGTEARLRERAAALGCGVSDVAAEALDRDATQSPPVATSPKCLHGEAENSGESWPPVAKPETS
jgi:predicted kinase